MPFKRGVGRPTKGPGEKKEVYITVRMSTEDHSKLYYLQQKLGKSCSEIFRTSMINLFNEEIKK